MHLSEPIPDANHRAVAGQWLNLEGADMSALWSWETCLPVGKRRRVAALQIRPLPMTGDALAGSHGAMAWNDSPCPPADTGCGQLRVENGQKAPLHVETAENEELAIKALVAPGYDDVAKLNVHVAPGYEQVAKLNDDVAPSYDHVVKLNVHVASGYVLVAWMNVHVAPAYELVAQRNIVVAPGYEHVARLNVVVAPENVLVLRRNQRVPPKNRLVARNCEVAAPGNEHAVKNYVHTARNNVDAQPVIRHAVAGSDGADRNYRVVPLDH